MQNFQGQFLKAIKISGGPLLAYFIFYLTRSTGLSPEGQSVLSIAAGKNLLAGLNYATDGIKEETINRSKPMIQTIDSFKLRFMLPKGYRYYEEATVRLNDELQNAWSLLRSSENPGENVSHAIENAKKSSEVIATNLEDFLKKDYQPFMDELRNNALEINWIKPLK